jgi:protein arginine kinase
MIDLSLVSDGGIGWLDGSGPESHLVLSTRVRLARNLAGRPFPGRAPDADRAEVLEGVRGAARQTGSLGQASLIRLDRLPRMDRQFLHERHLVSKELAAPGADFPPRPGAAVMLQGPLGAMVNEEDHLRLQGLVSGLDLAAAWAAVGTLDAELGQRLAFAFHPEFGYLTSCPTNVGTGLRASVLIHLPGLVLTKEINKVLQSLVQVGLTFRGLYGEGSEVVGNFFQLSNQTTLGKSEPELLDHLTRMVRQVIGVIEDKVWRAYGLLRYARALSFEEAMNLLSGVRLGVGLGLIPGVSVYALNKLLVFTQPAHLAAMAGNELAEDEIPVRRADYVRRVMDEEAGR